MSKYVYYEAGQEPTKDDIEASEILEGRLREGFVRLRQLLVSSYTFHLPAPPLDDELTFKGIDSS